MSAFRRERQAEEALVAHGFEVFLPKVVKTVKEPHRRARNIEVPAVATLIFVRATASALTEYKLRVDTRLKFYTIPSLDENRNRPLVVPDNEMEAFMRVWQERDGVKAEIHAGTDVPPSGARVRITGGPLEGLEGTCIGRQGRSAVRLSVSLHGLLTVTATIPLSLITPLA